MKRIVLAGFCLSGMAALAYEVVWTRALSFTFGSTVYALSTILATFMAGLALGAYLGGKVADRKADLLLYFGLFESGIGLFGFLVVPAINSLPPIYFAIYKTFHFYTWLFYSAQFAVSAAIMIVPTTLMGATFPVVSRWLTEDLGEMGRKVGAAYSANTVGAIFGSVAAGFILIPSLGIKWSSYSAGIVNLATGLAVIAISRRKAAAVLLPIIAVAASLGALFTSWGGIKHPYGTFYHAIRFEDFESLKLSEKRLEMLSMKDYAEGHVIAWREGEYFLILQHGGKMEGTGAADVPNTVNLVTLPAAALSTPPNDVLIVGLGAGVTTMFAKGVARNVEVAEINPGIVEAVRDFGVPGTLDGVRVRMGDARTTLLYSDRKYDMIVSEPSVPSEAISANLFTREFYEIEASRLKEGGVAAQWLPGWMLTVKDARACIKTFATVFDHVYLWRVYTSNDYIMIGSKTPFTYLPLDVERRSESLVRSILPPRWEADMVDYGVDIDSFFKVGLIRDDVSIKEILAMEDIPTITDDKPIIEYLVTKNYLLGIDFKKYRE